MLSRLRDRSHRETSLCPRAGDKFDVCGDVGFEQCGAQDGHWGLRWVPWLTIAAPWIWTAEIRAMVASDIVRALDLRS